MIASGCQSASSTKPIAQYSPQLPPVILKAPRSAVFVLWRDQNIAPVPQMTTTAAATRAVKPHRMKSSSLRVEIEQVYVEKGSLIGFRMRNDNLTGVAGPTSMPLASAHYAWRLRDYGSADYPGLRTRNIVDTILIVACVTAAAGIIVGVFHANRHHDILGTFLEDLLDPSHD